MINFSLIPPPNMVEALDYPTIFNQMVADLRARDVIYTNILESDPAYKILEVAAYRELLMRQRVNDGVRGSMLATATAADLDNLGMFYGVLRLVISPADPNTVPPTDPVLEPDADFRNRILLAVYARTTAGPANQYKFIAKSADSDVLDVSVVSPSAGNVLLTLMSRTGDGTPTSALLQTVLLACSADDVRPLTDHVTTSAVQVVHYIIDADLYVYPGPDSQVVLANALAAANAYAAAMHKIGYDIQISAIHGALQVEGVQRVVLLQPTASLVMDDYHAPYVDAINVRIAGVDQ